MNQLHTNTPTRDLPALGDGAAAMDQQASEEYAIYQQLRQVADAEWRQMILDHPGVLGSVTGETAKLRRVGVLLDLAYGLPWIETQAQIERLRNARGTTAALHP